LKKPLIEEQFRYCPLARKMTSFRQTENIVVR